MHTVLEVKLQQCGLQCENHFFQLVSCTGPKVPQDYSWPFIQQGTLLIHTELARTSLPAGLHSSLLPAAYTYIQGYTIPHAGSGICTC